MKIISYTYKKKQTVSHKYWKKNNFLYLHKSFSFLFQMLFNMENISQLVFFTFHSIFFYAQLAFVFHLQNSPRLTWMLEQPLVSNWLLKYPVF